MAAADVDVGYLATQLGMPQDDISTVATQPSVDLVKTVLSAAAEKLRQLDALEYEKSELQVYIETHVRNAESLRDKSSETAKQALKDVEEIRQKLNQEETTRQTLENELQTYRSSNSTSQSEIDSLHARIASLETSNRESLRVIDSKNSAHEGLAEELQAQHQKNLRLSQEISGLRQSESDATSRVNSARFREQSLNQQLEAAHRDVEYYQTELNTKSAEALKFRKEKGARIADLERNNEDQKSTIDSLKRTDEQLRQRLNEAQQKLEDALTKIQQLEEAAARREEDFRQECDGLNRLVDLKEQQTATYKNRVMEVEAREDQVKREYEDKIRRINEDLARAETIREELTQANESLHAEVGRLEAMLATPSRASPAPGSAPQTPRPMNGSVGLMGSPMPTPGSIRKSLSATQAIEEYYKVKGLLSVEKKRSKTLETHLDEAVELLKAKEPELEELQAENDRFQQELRNMSQLSDDSFRERDSAKRAARKAEAAATTAQAETKILRSQLRDLGAQIQLLLFNQYCAEKGLDQITMDEALHLQKLERGQVDNEEESDINSMILQNLVVFKEIQELQEKNEQLLKVTHELGAQMESEENDAAKQQAAEDHKEVAVLRQKLQIFEDELGGLKVRADSIMKERDMFRRIVESRASADEMASALGHSTHDGVLTSIEQNSTMNEDGSDYTTLLRELQQNFDSYRTEQGVDRKTMREQIDKLSSEKNALQLQVSKLGSQLSLATERHEMLRSNYAALQSENQELQKRNQQSSETAAKLDVIVNQSRTDLIDATDQMSKMRNDIANLTAEKRLNKDIQDRLTRDNEELIQDRSRLNGLLVTNQTLQNERELTESETKRRLQNQVEGLETEITNARRQLAESAEEVKKAQLRKEYDTQQFQGRIDDLTSKLSQTREELASTKTSRDHLQSRVDELTIELRSAEERAERLQPRPTPRPGSILHNDVSTAADVDSDERIQELVHEVTDLKRDLELARTHLENAQSQAESYRELSQASEEELERLNAAQAQFTEEIESKVADRDAKVKELEQRIEDLSSELSRSNNELTELRDSQGEISRAYEEEKALLKSEIQRLKDEEERYIASSQFHQQDLRAQADIATHSQQAYENEVVKHGETTKTLSTLRAEHGELKASIATLKAEAESARATLLQNESSWEERKQRLERELNEIKARRSDADAQNKILHQQLDSVSSQVSALQQSRASAGESLEAISAQPSTSDVDNMRELVNYLRSEKEILEVQYDLKVQDFKRAQQKASQFEAQCSELRLKLEQEREAQAGNQKSTMAHKDLMGKLEELNLYRESSAALRAEARQAQAQLTEQTAKVASLEASIHPLHAQIEELQSQQSFKEAELKQLQADRDRWQKRTEDIIAKRGSADPGEVEELRGTITQLESQLATLQELQNTQEQKVQELEAAIIEKESTWAASKERLINSAKEKARSLLAQKNEVVGEKDQLMGQLNSTQAQLNDANTQLTTTREELELSKKEKADFEQQVTTFKRQVELLQEEAKNNAAAAAPPAPATTSATTELGTVFAEPSEQLQAQLATLQEQLANTTAEKNSVEQELQNARAQLDTVIAERDQAISAAQNPATNGDVSMENGGEQQSQGVPSTSLTDDERRGLEEKLSTAEAKVAELEAKIKEMEETTNSTLKARSDKMKEALNSRLRSEKAKFEEEMTKLRQEKEQAETEKVKVESDLKLSLEQERKIWELERAGLTSGDSKPPDTPSKQQPQQQFPSTPQSAPSGPVPDMQGLGDREVRDLVSNNPTIKNIIQNNIRNKLALETKKLRDELDASMKSEWDVKIEKAREQATQLANSKFNLKLNMSEKKASLAKAQITVVETAAQDTPQRAVVEVWNEAKNAKPPAPAPAPAATPAGTPAATPVKPAPTVAPQATPTSGQAASESKAATNIPKPGGNAQVSSGIPVPGQQQQQAPLQGQQQAGAAVANQQAQQGGQKGSGLPMPRKASGPYQPPAQRGGRGGQRGGRGGNRGSLNASAENFQPGNKRPRNDSEAGGNGAKRPRGGGPQ